MTRTALVALLVLVLVAVAVPPLGAFGAIGFDAASNAGDQTGGSFSFNHTVTSTADRALFVIVHMHDTTDGDRNLASVVASGTAMTRSVRGDNGSGNRTTEIWTLANPNAGVHTIVVSSTGGSINEFTAGALSFTDVSQANPVFATNTRTGTSATPSTTISMSNGGWAIGGLSLNMNDATLLSVSTGTQRYEVDTGSFTNSGASRGPNLDTSSPKIGWNGGISTDYAIALLSMREELGSAPPAVLAMETLTDNFDDNAVSSTLWTTSTALGATVSEVNSRIQIQPATSTDSSEGELTSAVVYDLTDSYALTEVPQVAEAANLYTNLKLYIDDDNYIALGVNDTDLEAIHEVGGSFALVGGTTYNSTTMRWWRIREAKGRVFWDYSADGNLWQNLIYEDNPFDVTELLASYEVFEHDPTATPGTAIFDNFNVGGTVPLVETLQDNFDDNSIDTAKWVEFEQLGATITETNQRLEYDLADNTNQSWAGVNSKFLYQVQSSTAYVEFVAAGSGNSWFDLTLSEEPLDIVNNFFSIGVNVGEQDLEAVVTDDSNDIVYASTTYNSTTMRWGRIRYGTSSLFWEYASDVGGSWTELYETSTATFPVDLKNLYVVLDDFEYDALSTLSVHALDNFNTSSQAVAETVARRRPVIIID